MIQKIEYQESPSIDMSAEATPSIFNESFNIRSYDVRPDGSAKLTTICNFLQETASNHAHELDYDIQTLRQTNQTWILYRLQLEIQRYPRWGDTIQVETWPSGGKSLLAYRDFMFTDQNMDLLGRGISQWMIIDLQTGRPIRMPDEVLDLQVGKRHHMLQPRRDKIHIPSSEQETTSADFKIRRNDLDLNGHVNNVSYIHWINESVPRDVYRNRRLSHLDIIFHEESNLGDEIIANAYRDTENSDEFVHQINRQNDSEALSTARSRWEHSSDFSKFYN